MTTMQIEMDEKLADAIRQKAQLNGKTPEAWVIEVAAKELGATDARHWVDRFLDIADSAGGDSQGQTWTREDIYDR